MKRVVQGASPTASSGDRSTSPALAGDLRLVATWAARHRNRHTRRSYERHARAFLTVVAKPLGEVRSADIQAYLDALCGLAPSSRAMAAAAIRSLFRTALDLGWVECDASSAVRAPVVRKSLPKRVLDEDEVARLLALARGPRNRALIMLLYCGLRASEACHLRWRDLRADGEAGLATVSGWAGAIRAVPLPSEAWSAIQAIRDGAGDADPVFRSRKGGRHLDPSMAHRIVKAAVAEAGLPAEASAHWLRHAHASHGLARGASVGQLQSTLGHASAAAVKRYRKKAP